MRYSHIVWTTFDSWLPHEKRGGWKSLADLYESLEGEIVVGFSKPLQKDYTNSLKDRQVILSGANQELLKKEILDLALNDGIAGGLNILSIAVTSSGVHLLIKGTLDEEKQKLARLKSRSATLLHFANGPKDTTAKNTWSKGFWAAELKEHHDLFKIKSYINQQGA